MSNSPKPLKRRRRKERSFWENRFSEKSQSSFQWQTAIKCLCAFLLSRTSLIGGAHPLGFAISIAMLPLGGGYICALFSALGLILSGVGLLPIGKYIIAFTIYSLIEERFISKKNKNAALSALIASLCLLATGFFLLCADITFGGYPLIYDSLVLIVECATVYLAVKAFTLAIPLVFSLRLRRSLTTEETVSVAFFAGGVICGLGNAGINGVFSFSGVLCVLCVLIFAVRFGSLHGCGAGIIMGIVSCLSRGRIDACAASFAFSGLCAGYTARYGKWSACVSFIIANAIVTIFSNGSTEVLINIFDTTLASVILYCFPQRLFDSLSHFSGFSPPALELAAGKLISAKNTISSLEASFKRIFNLRNSEENNTLILYKRTAHNTCSSCGLRKYCWGRDSKATKESMDKLCSLLHSGEEPSCEDAPIHCLRKEQFVEQFKKMFEVYKNDCIWTQKIDEFRQAVYSSYNGIGEMLKKSGENLLSKSECDVSAADDIRIRLRKANISVSEIFVTGHKEETVVRMKLESCGGFGRCENAVCNILEETLNMPFVKCGLRNCSDCFCNYVVKPSFSITTAVAGAIKANKKVSGDYVIYSLLDRHTYAIILCDGMGSGETAREESRTASKLLMQLLEADIPPQNAINLINSMLLSAFSGALTAIDLCLINLDDATTSIYKCGSASTYAKTEGNVSQIYSKTLPVGAFAASDMEIFSVPSKKGSMVILMSDGVCAAENSRLPWIKDMISTYEGTEPEDLAQMILKKAREATNSVPDDDLTVVAAYIG